jgi:two-component system, NtrC family, sensor kinase
MTSVLIVDDSLTVRMDLVNGFQAAGFHTLPCATVAEARDTVSHTDVDVVILDLVLPDGDGIELLSHLRAEPRSARAAVLMLSSEAEVKDRLRGLDSGADDYAGKPYDLTYLVARSRELLRARMTAAAGGPVVLVIDDSPTFRAMLTEALDAAGYTALAVATGQDGLHTAANHRPDAIIVDGQLPDADGPDVIRRLRQDSALRGIPCLLLTAADDPSAEVRALDAGADSFAHKGDTAVVLAKLAATLRATARSTLVDTISLLGAKKILLIDAEADDARTILTAVRGEGFDIIQATSRQQALHLLATQAVDCIMVGSDVPDAGTRETCRHIKADPRLRHVPLIIAGGGDHDNMIASLAAGADDYVGDFTDRDVVRARIRSHIRRKQYEDQTRLIQSEFAKGELQAAQVRAATELAETRATLVTQLERKNEELEAFSYSVSHDLRNPLHLLINYAELLLEDAGGIVHPDACEMIERILSTARHMSGLVEDLLELSKVSNTTLRRAEVNLSALAADIVGTLRDGEPTRSISVVVAPGLLADADASLVRILLDNLLGNAWKYTSRIDAAVVEFGSRASVEGTVYFVRDNGAGFDAERADQLFRPFQRLHTPAQFPGTGIGLAIAQRIVDRHGGRIWAESRDHRGATFSFTLPDAG